jgi:murein DD-endopeptidase MepM/ murein hydrolase activator NlpD
MKSLEEAIHVKKDELSNIFPFDLKGQGIYHLDLSVDNPEIYEFDILDTEQLSDYIQHKLIESEALIAIGGYGENRLVYQRSEHFGSGEDARCIHLGVDVWCEAMTPVFAPLDARIHSFQDNDQSGDYGPTILLEHDLGDQHLYSLYGHLARRSLDGLKEGMKLKAGEKFAEIGDVHENGQWPPHLHFQLIRDLKDKKGDFPGVASKKDWDYYREMCPDPYLLIKK